MAIEFICPNCQQQLRVPDDAVGKNAKCPKCTTILVVPSTSASSSPLAPPPQAGFNFQPGPPKPPAKPVTPSNFPVASGGSPFAAPAGNNPFSDGGKLPPTTQATIPPLDAGASNPYASPMGVPRPYFPAPAGGVGHQIVEVSPVVNHALAVWKENLGVLLPMTLIPFAVMIPLMLLMFAGMGVAEALDAPALGIVLFPLFYIAMIGTQIFFTIGQVQMCTKLARGLPVTLGEIMGGGDRFWPVLGFSLLAGIVLQIGFMACLAPGIILLLYFWPSYYLIIDRKCGISDSFALAKQITEGNKLTTFVLVLVTYGFVLLGELACLVGLLFAMPLVTVLWATAYLMMSGQIPVPQPQRPRYYGPPGQA